MNYKKLVKDGGFISQYMDYMSDIETPEAYDFWCAIWAIGATCGRNVFVDRPHLPVHLNWYIILSADSGTTRKSTAVRSIEKITDPLLGGLTVITKVSPERLINSLWDKAKDQDTATCIIVVPELVTLLGKEGYMVNMPSLLTDLYDCPNRIDGGTKDETITVRNIYVNLLRKLNVRELYLGRVRKELARIEFEKRLKHVAKRHEELEKSRAIHLDWLFTKNGTHPD